MWRKATVVVVLAATLLMLSRPVQAQIRWHQTWWWPIVVSIVLHEINAHRPVATLAEYLSERYHWMARWVDEEYWQVVVVQTCEAVRAGRAEELVRSNDWHQTEEEIIAQVERLEWQCAL